MKGSARLVQPCLYSRLDSPAPLGEQVSADFRVEHTASLPGQDDGDATIADFVLELGQTDAEKLSGFPERVGSSPGDVIPCEAGSTGEHAPERCEDGFNAR